ncbi:MAG: class I SAM-dependent methyltransferase [Caldilineaceae bacterium]|nr:class I SAM-dependent methyltransferase [Caldilineaceae bacterium]
MKIADLLNRAKDEAILRTLDLVDDVFRRRDPLTPPRRLMFDGPRDPAIFKASGAEFLHYYVDLCGLRPDAHILDVGCGIGRKTIPLLGFLNGDGRYEGMDVNRVGIDWCTQHIARRHSNFNFQQIDVFNQRYNPSGSQQPHTYRFPFDDNSFDFTVLASVFTHMFADGVDNYLSEIARTLRPGGKCLISYFLLTEDSRRQIDAGASAVDFPFDRGLYRIQSEDRREDAVAFPETYERNRYATHGLEIESIFYGAWSGLERALSYQDLVLARKL